MAISFGFLISSNTLMSMETALISKNEISYTLTHVQISRFTPNPPAPFPRIQGKGEQEVPLVNGLLRREKLVCGIS
jgi:hypothetical protein